MLGPVAVPRAPSTADERTLADLQLANRVMHETTRLHPAGAIAPREAAVDLTLGGYRISKGTLILWSAHLSGRDPVAWTDPLVFDPDRFVDPDPEQRALSDVAWVPFGRGARNCIGFALAEMGLTLIVARLAQRLDVELVTTEKPRPVGMVVNRPWGGAPVCRHSLSASARRQHPLSDQPHRPARSHADRLRVVTWVDGGAMVRQ